MPSKNCSEGDIGPYRREGGKKSPFISSSKRGHILMGEVSKSFCLMSHVPIPLVPFRLGLYTNSLPRTCNCRNFKGDEPDLYDKEYCAQYLNEESEL